MIAVDRNAPDAPGDTFIATDSVAAARTLGEYVCKVTQGKGKVAIIQGQIGTTPELDRDKGFNEALAKCPGLEVVAKQASNMWMQDEGFAIAQDMQRAAEQLRRLGLDVPPTTLVRTLRIAAQQQVEIAKALTLKARLLILDEPTAALGGDETDRLFVQVDQLRKQGVSFIYISHRLEEISRIADRIEQRQDNGIGNCLSFLARNELFASAFA